MSTIEERTKAGTTPFGFTLDKRVYGSRSSYATIVYFHYTKQNFGIPTNTGPKFKASIISDAERGIIEDDIQSVKIHKSIEASSGTFSVSLLPSKNWKQVLSPGDWMMIFIDDKSGDSSKYFTPLAGTKNLVMVANIDRVARTLSKNEDTDRNELRYDISGRGFGKVFEEADVWFDPYAIQNKDLEIILRNAGLEVTGSPATMVNKVVDIFLGGGADFPKGRTPDLGNFVIPRGLAEMLGTPGTSAKERPKFYDILKKKINPKLPGFKDRQMVTVNNNGSLDQLLRRCSNELTNQLYYEEARDDQGNVHPTLFLKSRPLNTPFFQSHCGTDSVAQGALSKLNGTVKTLQKHSDESFIEISPSEIIYENMGKDEHSRFNMYWMRPVNSMEDHFAYAAHNNNTGGIANPTFNSASIQRHGLKRFDQILEFCHLPPSGNASNNSKTTPEILLWKAFLVQLYDMHYANHLYDAGTIECTGVLEAELGKALIVKSDRPSTPDKVYYIEGYEHSWSFPSKWTTTFTVTHGQFKTDDLDIFIDCLGPDDYGTADEGLTSVYTAKTVTSKEKRT